MINQGNLIMSILKKRRILKNFIMGGDATEFVNRVNDEVRNRQKRMSNVSGEGKEHSTIWGMFMAVTMNAATFMGKNFQGNQNSILNTSDLTLKKMFDISAKLGSEQDEIFKVKIRRNQRRADGIRVEHSFSQDSPRFSSMIKSQIY